MSSYHEFAGIYEEFMRDAPYEQWMTWLQQKFPDMSRFNVADVGCGTGTLTRQMARIAQQMIGVDPSEEMLGVAAQRAMTERLKVRWLCQNATSMKLPEPVDLIVSSCDSLNYILTEADFQQTLKQFWSNLRPGGFLTFDLIGQGRLLRLEQGFSYDIREDAAVLFETTVENGCEITYDLLAFVETDEGLYHRFEECHQQRYYSEPVVSKWLEQVGFTVTQVSGDFESSVVNEAERVVFTAQKPSGI